MVDALAPFGGRKVRRTVQILRDYIDAQRLATLDDDHAIHWIHDTFRNDVPVIQQSLDTSMS